MIRVLALVLLTTVLPASLFADEDWKQWGGPNRDFRVQNTELPDKIELKETWRRELGGGFSAILVENDRLFTMYRKGDDEFVVSLNRKTGKTVWEKKYSAPMSKDAETSFGKGPNSTPIIAGDRLIAIGFNGDMHCLNKSNGEVHWQKNVFKDLGGTYVDMGYSQSPIIYKDNLILPIGGKGKGFAGIRIKDGSIAWSNQDFKNSYSTPLLVQMDGLDQMIFVMTDQVVSISPKDGKLFWTFDLKNQWSTHAFVPLWDKETKTLFVSSFRQSHALKLEKKDDKVSYEKVWSIPTAGVGFTNAVIVDGIIVGSTGGSRSPLVTAIDLSNGKILWKKRGFGVCNYLAVGKRLVMLDDKGNLAVAQPSRSSLEIVKQEKVLGAGKVWTVPTLVGREIFVRDQKEIAGFEIK